MRKIFAIFFILFLLSPVFADTKVYLLLIERGKSTPLTGATVTFYGTVNGTLTVKSDSLGEAVAYYNETTAVRFKVEKLGYETLEKQYPAGTKSFGAILVTPVVPDEPPVIIVKVVDESGKAIEGAEVYFYDKYYKEITTLTTNSQGLTSELENGYSKEFGITITKSGYKEGHYEYPGNPLGEQTKTYVASLEVAPEPEPSPEPSPEPGPEINPGPEESNSTPPAQNNAPPQQNVETVVETPNFFQLIWNWFASLFS